MLGTLVRWLILTLAVWVAAYVVPGIAYDHWQNLLVAALVLGILNAFVKPILMLISLPLIFVTFGLFLVLINALLLKARPGSYRGCTSPRSGRRWAAAWLSVSSACFSAIAGCALPNEVPGSGSRPTGIRGLTFYRQRE